MELLEQYWDLSLGQTMYLALVWAVWCLVHSLLLWRPWRDSMQARLKLSEAGFRLGYCVFSLVSVLPPLWLGRRLGGHQDIMWPWPWALPQALVWGWAVLLMIWAERGLSRAGFDLFGFSALSGSGTRPEHRLVTGGAYAISRHPMHLAGLIMLWARPQDPADLVVSLVLSIYILLGNRFEQARMRAQFGQAYDDYLAQTPFVPRLIPKK